MKTTIFSIFALLSVLLGPAVADIIVNSFPDVVYIGESYNLSWTATVDYVYDVWLVLDSPSEGLDRWTPVTEVAPGLRPASLSVSYVWTVPSNVSTRGLYGFWISGTHMTTDFSGNSDSTLTDWFTIASYRGPASTPTSSGTSTASSSAATSTRASSLPGSTASTTPSPSHHTSISGGAIAGIVIGCLVFIALVIGAVLFTAWRRKRSAKQTREAEARAGRLAPVMKKEGGSFEMHGRPSQTV